MCLNSLEVSYIQDLPPNDSIHDFGTPKCGLWTERLLGSLSLSLSLSLYLSISLSLSLSLLFFEVEDNYQKTLKTFIRFPY